MKTCILNFATRSNPSYLQGQRRLVRSLKENDFNGDIITWNSEAQFGSPMHKRVPYAFKPYALDWARKEGYDAALWLDASFWAVRPLTAVFKTIVRDGYLMQNDGNRLGNWAHDKCLEKFDVTRDEAMNIRMFSAGCTGLYFDNKTSEDFLDWWLEASGDGESFQGPWVNKNKSISKDPRCKGHRHDMTIGTLIAHKLNMKYQPAWSIFTYGENKNHPNVYMICKGM